MNKVIITGGFGLLGSSLNKFLIDKGYKTFPLSRNDKISKFNGDVRNKDEFIKTINQIRPNFLINLIANTNVDDCERDVNFAYVSNVMTIMSIVEVIKTFKNIYLIHISTDQLYSGEGPHIENKINPLNVYALTKRLGEIEACKVPSTILRVNFVGKSFSKNKKSFSDQMINTLLKEEKIKVFDDVFFSPLHITSLCKVIECVMLYKKTGVYNVGTIDGITKADLVIKLAELLKLNVSKISQISVKNFNFVAKRPFDMRMKVNKFERIYNYNLPTIDNEIDKLKFDYKDL